MTKNMQVKVMNYCELLVLFLPHTPATPILPWLYTWLEAGSSSLYKGLAVTARIRFPETSHTPSQTWLSMTWLAEAWPAVVHWTMTLTPSDLWSPSWQRYYAVKQFLRITGKEGIHSHYCVYTACAVSFIQISNSCTLTRGKNPKFTAILCQKVVSIHLLGYFHLAQRSQSICDLDCSWSLIPIIFMYM